MFTKFGLSHKKINLFEKCYARDRFRSFVTTAYRHTVHHGTVQNNDETQKKKKNTYTIPWLH